MLKLDSMATLSLRTISKTYGKQRILDAIDLHLESGSSLALVGPNGAGKTTLLRLMAGQLLPDEGSMTFDQVLMGRKGWPEHIRRRIGLSLGLETLPNDLTPFEFLSFIGQLYRLPSAQWRERRDSLLTYLLDPKDHHKLLYQLSSGNQMKVAVAAAYLPNPDLVLLDEPFNGLDLIGAQQVMELIRGRQHQAITLISSHNLAVIPDLCDKVGILYRQKWAYLGETYEFRNEGGKQLSEQLLNVLQPEKTDLGKLSWQK